MQLLAALKDATERLTRSGVASPQVDAELLLAHVTGVSRGEVLAWVHTDRSLTADQVVDWDRLLARREKREPLQHLTGTAAFMSFEVSVGPGVFVPRPETQALVEAAIDQALAMGVGEEGLRILDLCSGSGVVAISLARAIPHANVSAVEASPEALAYLEKNVENLAPNIRVVALSVAECAEEFGGSAFDMILANPPYVPVFEVPNAVRGSRWSRCCPSHSSSGEFPPQTWWLSCDRAFKSSRRRRPRNYELSRHEKCFHRERLCGARTVHPRFSSLRLSFQECRDGRDHRFPVVMRRKPLGGDSYLIGPP